MAAGGAYGPWRRPAIGRISALVALGEASMGSDAFRGVVAHELKKALKEEAGRKLTPEEEKIVLERALLQEAGQATEEEGMPRSFGPRLIPEEPHYAIIRRVSVTTPGDERSRTNPGHGYPESTEHYIAYDAFPIAAREEWESEVRSLALSGATFAAIEAYPARITREVTIGSTKPGGTRAEGGRA